MAWRNGVALPRTVGQQVLVGVVQRPWKLSHETQVSTPRMYGKYLVPYLLAIYREQDYQDGRTDSPCVLQDFVPFGAAALLPLNLNHTLHKQGTGTVDHSLPLGCYF